jgi:hypothetical protein
MTIRRLPKTLLFKISRAGLATSLTAAALLAASSAAQAVSYVYGEVQAGDPARNNTAATADIVGSPPLPAGGLPANGDALNIDGTLVALAGGPTDAGGACGNYLTCAGGGDWFSFMLAQDAPVLSLSMDSPHNPSANLGFDFFQVGTGPSLTSQAFTSPGGAGTALAGSFVGGSSYLVHIWGEANGVGAPDYSFNVEAIPEPSVFALTGAGLGLVAFLAMRRRV